VAWSPLAQKVANQNISIEDFMRPMIFPKSILSPLPSREHRSALAAGSFIDDRLRRRAEGEDMALFDDAAGSAMSRVQPAGLPALEETRLRRANGLTRQGVFRKSAQTLSSAPLAPKGEATVSVLQALHPPPTQGARHDRAHLQSPLPFIAEDIQASLRNFLKGLAPETSGLRHFHIDGMITAHSPQAAITALEALILSTKPPAPSSDPDWVDFSNYYSLVSRDIFSTAILENLPTLGPWVTWCYDNPSNFFFNGKVICLAVKECNEATRLVPCCSVW
jgi:hypothetical protein